MNDFGVKLYREQAEVDAPTMKCHTISMTTKKPSRVNARLSPEVARKVTYLETLTNMSTTLVLRESIERYYDAVTREAGTPAEIFAQTGFIGCADGPADLSSSYKEHLSRSLRDKL